MTPIRRILIIAVALTFAGCAATKQPSLYDAQPDLLTKQYTPDEIAAVKQNFDANPLQYSQELGNFMLWRINAKNNTFGRQLTELPDLNDGIDINEIDVLKTIDEYVEDVNFPPDFATKTKLEKRNLLESLTKVLDYHVLVKWSSEQENYSSGIITIIDPKNNLILKEVNPKSFEEGDSIVSINTPFNVKTGNAMIRINSLTSKDDEDYIELIFSASNNHSLQVGSGGSYTLGDESKIVYLSSTNENTESDRLAEKSEIVRLSSTNENAKKYSKVEILEDLTLDGLKHDEYRYSPSFEAFFWLIKDGKFNAESFEGEYSNSFEFTIKVWGDMGGKRWGEFDKVTSRLNRPNLLHYYGKMNISDEDYWGDRKTNKSVFESGRGNCVDVSQFNAFCLSKAGYKTYLIDVDTDFGWHVIAAFKDKGKIYILDKMGPTHYFKGPYDSLYKIPYSIRGFR